MFFMCNMQEYIGQTSTAMNFPWCLLAKHFATLFAGMQRVSARIYAEGDAGAKRTPTVEQSHANAPLISTALVSNFSILLLTAIGANNFNWNTVFCKMFDVFVVLLRFFYFMLQIGDSWSLHDTI